MGIDLDTAFGGAGVADQSAMLRERFDVTVLAELAQEHRRAFDVSEEEVTVPVGMSSVAGRWLEVDGVRVE